MNSIFWQNSTGLLDFLIVLILHNCRVSRMITYFDVNIFFIWNHHPLRENPSFAAGKWLNGNKKYTTALKFKLLMYKIEHTLSKSPCSTCPCWFNISIKFHPSWSKKFVKMMLSICCHIIHEGSKVHNFQATLLIQQIRTITVFWTF